MVGLLLFAGIVFAGLTYRWAQNPTLRPEERLYRLQQFSVQLWGTDDDGTEVAGILPTPDATANLPTATPFCNSFCAGKFLATYPITYQPTRRVVGSAIPLTEQLTMISFR